MKSEVKDGYTLKLGSAQVSFDALLNHRYAIDVGVDLIVLGIREELQRHAGEEGHRTLSVC